MPPERLLLCEGRPLNTELEAGALEITVLRVSEIASAILIMFPTPYPLCPLATSTGRRLAQSPAPSSLPKAPTACCWPLKIGPISETH